MKCWAHCTFSAPTFWITYKFWNAEETPLTLGIQDGWRSFRVLCAHLQRLNSWCDEVAYHANLSAFLWVSRKETRPRPGLVNVLDHCQLQKEEIISQEYSQISYELGFGKTWQMQMDSLTETGWCHQFLLQALVAWGLMSYTAPSANV